MEASQQVCEKLWQPPVDKGVIYFLMFSSAANYTAKKLKASVEDGLSRLEKLVSEQHVQARIVAEGKAHALIKTLSELRTHQPYIVEFCSAVAEVSSQALSAFGATYSVKAENPVAVLTLRTPVGESDMPIKLTPKPREKDWLKRHPVEMQALYKDITLLQDGMDSTAHVARQHLSSRIGSGALESAGNFLYKPL